MIGVSAIALAGSATAGCPQPSTTIHSKRAADFRDQVAALFVISEVGSDRELSARRFEDELSRMASSCDVKLAVSRVSTLELDPGSHVEKMKQFGAPHVLVVDLVGGVVSQAGGHAMLRYDARLLTVSQDKIVWRADIELRPHGDGDPAAILAWDLLMRLKADGLTRPCPALDAMNPAEETWKAKVDRQRARGK